LEKWGHAVTINQAQAVRAEQCAAALAIKERFGLKSAFDYLVAEKLMNFAEAAWKHCEFARELPAFVAEVRRIFALRELEEHLIRMERELVDADQAESAEDGEADDDFADPPVLIAARQKRFSILKAMLLETHLGTS
jgi:hypothetical protein